MSRLATGVRIQRMAPRRSVPRAGNGVLQVAAGFGVVFVAGTLLLLTPFATESGETPGLRTAAFTATSAICVTGLVLEDTQTHWNTFGEVVILVLIQIGGLGYMIGTTMVLWIFGRQLGIRDRHMLRQYYGAPSMREALSFARGVALFTFAFEAVGAVILTLTFMADGEPLGTAWWWGLFHSISAFNNAGFSVTGSDLIPHSDDPVLLTTVMVLVIAGGLGFIPIVALAQRRSWRRLPLDSKLIFATSAALLVAGSLFIGAMEWRNDETFGERPVGERVLQSVFHSANSRTAGFTTVNMGALHDETKVAMVALMFVGGAAGSTAGGLKVGAFSMLLAVMISTLAGRNQPTAFKRSLPVVVVQQATTLALYHVALLFGVSLALTTVTGHAFVDLLFEAASALGTVGYSTAGTPSLGATAHVILIVAMLLGRFSPLLLVLHMSRPRKQTPYQYPSDSVRLS